MGALPAAGWSVESVRLRRHVVTPWSRENLFLAYSLKTFEWFCRTLEANVSVKNGVMNDPLAAYFEKLPKIHKCQFVQRVSGASFYFQKRLAIACELAGASAGRLLDCAAGTGEITCLQKWTSRHGADAIYLLAPNAASEKLRSQ